MLEKDSRAGMLDCVEEVSSLASENTRTSNYCSRSNNRDSTSGGFHSNGPILDDKNAAVGENLYSYSLVPISQADNDLSFFDSNHEDKNTTDLLYYSWPEMENFEDVDRMFRSCDSTFGLGASIEDALGLFPSSDVIEGSGGGLRSDFEFPCPSSSALENISGSQEASRRKETCSSINDSGTKDDPFSHTGSSMPSEDDSAFLNHLYFLNGSSDSDCKIVPKKKINLHKKHSKHRNQSEGKTKDVYLGTGETYNYINSLPEEKKHPTAITASQVALTSTGIQQQMQVDGSDFGCFQGGNSYLSSDYSHSDQTTVCPTLSIVKSGKSSLMPLSAKDSYPSNQTQSMESLPDPSFQVAGIGTNENMAEKLLHHSGVKHENNRDLGSVCTGIPAELGSSIVKESSCISFGLNEISEEAKSFHQLQRVMERLDIRTKLRIRDSLYRLAQSAEQRLRYANLNNGSGDNRSTSGAFVDDGAYRCTGYLDMETNTNSIDRSIAHLLFHRPSNSSVMPDSLALKSPSMVGVSTYASKFPIQQSVSQNIPCNLSVNRCMGLRVALK
ncbi:protein LNK1-like isoform X1 [Lycium barbarum]|uniref:protein LNK1-like isoform X1 n=1 Tax=Lycium barbarum TaxID=112863 RepID=UPI00293E4FDA|nr:protein LNK1-like isoform X1 [Lycium barbarum]XP_060184179.1 protein LNK1-like isoform X1 [Lycium barbarum]